MKARRLSAMPAMLNDDTGNRAMAITPAVILLAFRFGMRFALNTPLVMMLAARFGIRATPNFPLVIMDAGRFGDVAHCERNARLANRPVRRVDKRFPIQAIRRQWGLGS